MPERGEGAYRHWPDDRPVVGNLLRIKRDEFCDAGMLPPVILNVALDLLRHFFLDFRSSSRARLGGGWRSRRPTSTENIYITTCSSG